MSKLVPREVLTEVWAVVLCVRGDECSFVVWKKKKWRRRRMSEEKLKVYFGLEL